MSKGYRLPRGEVRYDTLLNVLKGYLNAGADQEYVSSREVAEKLGVGRGNISRNVVFFVDFGFLEHPEGKKLGGCKLVPEAIEFAGAYKIAPNAKTTRHKLGQILRKHPVVDTCLKRLENNKQSLDEFYTFILSETTDHKTGQQDLNTFVDLLIYGALLKRENDYFMPLTEGEVPELHKKVSGVSRKSERKIKLKDKTPKREDAPSMPTVFPSFLISLTPDTPREKIKEMVTAVLEAMDEHKKKAEKK